MKEVFAFFWPRIKFVKDEKLFIGNKNNES